MAGLGRPTSDSINKNFAGKIEDRSEIYVDGTHAYDSLAEKSHCDIKHLIGYESFNKVEHLNTVNSIHSMIKRIYGIYRGVASHYLNRYLALFVFMKRFMDMDDNEIAELLIRKLKECRYNISRKNLKQSISSNFIEIFEM